MTIRPAGAVLPIGLLVLAACGKQDANRGPLVLLRFENLTGNPALDWMSRGAPRQIALQIEGTAIVDSPQRGGDRERAIAGGAKRILHGYVSQSGGRLRLHVDLEDAASGKFPQSAESAGQADAGLLPLVDAVARQLDPQARPFGAKSEAALKAYIGGLNATDPGEAADLFSRAVAADRNFGAAYLSLIQLNLARQDRAGAEGALSMARARGGAISPADRARLEVAAAQISRDPAALSKSLAALSQLTPADANLMRSLAESELAARRYSAAIDYYKRALATLPGDAALLNGLGYAQAYAGDLDGAVKSLEEYARAHPNEANPLDSMGDVHFYYGRFSEAEKFYREAHGKDATFLNSASLLKAAKARLMTGDVSGAESVFGEYEAARRAANDPAVDFNRANWDYLRGKRTEAVRRMDSFAGAAPGRDLAHCILTIWLLEAGDRDAAAKHAPCRFLTEPRAATFPNPVARIFALLLAKDFEAALPLVRETAARSAPNATDTAPVLLAWTLVETGHIDEAEKYLQTNPVPAAPAQDPFESLIYPRIFRLRAAVAEKKGANQAAEQNNKIFQTLSGK